MKSFSLLKLNLYENTENFSTSDILKSNTECIEKVALIFAREDHV